MAADIFQACQQVVSLLNVGEGASVYSLNVSSLTDGRYSINEIVEAVCETDEDVRLAIRESVDHWAQGDDMSLSSALAYGDKIDHVGNVGEVLIQRSLGGDFVPARGIKTRAEIERYRANTGTSPNNVYGSLAHDAASSPLSGFYDISPDARVRFTGSALKVRSASLARLFRTVYDGAMTSASATLNSTTGAFASTDVNSMVIIEGARTTNLLPLVSQIVSPIGSTSVPLRDSNTSGGNITGKRVMIARLGSPAAYLPAIVRGARGRLFKEGDNADKAPFFNKVFWEVDMRMIRGGAQSVPDEMREAA